MSQFIKCDFCEKPLNESVGITNFILTLSCQSLPHTGGYVLDTLIYPTINENKHFCGLGCLSKWVEKQ